MKVKKISLLIIAIMISFIFGASTLVQAATPSASEWQLPVYFGTRELKYKDGSPDIGYAIGEPGQRRRKNMGYCKI